MIIMLLNEDKFIMGETIDNIMDQAIQDGWFANSIEFVDSIEAYEFYRLDNRLTVTGAHAKPVFTVE